MSAPTPKPRIRTQNTSVDCKKPIPAPRTLIPIISPEVPIANNAVNNENNHTTTVDNNVNKGGFTRRVRTLSNTSKQIAEDSKKAVIESTRQSVRKLTRRFTAIGTECELSECESATITDNNNGGGEVFKLFNTISFKSPMGLNEDYENSEITSPPPPKYPPPPLREEIYDEPNSVISGESNTSGSSNNSSTLPAMTIADDSCSSYCHSNHNNNNYESVFPSQPYNSDSDGCVDMTTALTLDRTVNDERCQSWNFYDPLPPSRRNRKNQKTGKNAAGSQGNIDSSSCHGNKNSNHGNKESGNHGNNDSGNHGNNDSNQENNENIYNNVDNTPVMSVMPVGGHGVMTATVKDDSGVTMRNVYENHSIAAAPSTAIPTRGAPTQSILLQFDPLTMTSSTTTTTHHCGGGSSNNHHHNNTGTCTGGGGGSTVTASEQLLSLAELLDNDLYVVNNNGGGGGNYGDGVGGLGSEDGDGGSVTMSIEEEEEEMFPPPPPPPVRVDSLLPEEQQQLQQVQQQQQEQPQVDCSEEPSPSSFNTKHTNHNITTQLPSLLRTSARYKDSKPFKWLRTATATVNDAIKKVALTTTNTTTTTMTAGGNKLTIHHDDDCNSTRQQTDDRTTTMTTMTSSSSSIGNSSNNTVVGSNNGNSAFVVSNNSSLTTTTTNTSSSSTVSAKTVSSSSTTSSSAVSTTSSPAISTHSTTNNRNFHIQHRGLLYRLGRGGEQLFSLDVTGSRWAVLEGGALTAYADVNCTQGGGGKENLRLEDVVYVQVVMTTAAANDKFNKRHSSTTSTAASDGTSEELFGLEIGSAAVNKSPRGLGGGNLTITSYGAKTRPERRVWLQKLAESVTASRFSATVTSDYTRVGWAYVSEGVSGEWFVSWILLAQRKLYYSVDGNNNTSGGVKVMDLRTARCIVLSPVTASSGGEDNTTPKTLDNGPNMIVDCPSGALYVRGWTQRVTKGWAKVVRLEAHNNGAMLDQQQLTKNDIPVIIEKCINFIYVNGSMSEGIYRKPGNNTKVSELLEQFTRDAWAVQLTLDTHSENDVATALKRFFRDLPQPLFPHDKRQYLIQVSKVKSRDERVRMFKAVLEQLPTITYKTIRKLFGHLAFVSSQHQKNLMSVENLAAIWGPSLMPHESNNPQLETAVIGQLIALCGDVFPENGRAAEMERAMLRVLERCANSPQGVAVNCKTSGDLRMWIYLHSKMGKAHHVAIGPQRTAYEILCELSTSINIPVHELVLEEWILNETMTRPIHYTEKVLNIVLKWGYWEENDRKDNCLIVTRLNKYMEYMEGALTSPLAELRYADSRSKQMKPYMFEFSQAKLRYYKDRYSLSELGSWNIEDIVWYLGHEGKRANHIASKYTVTFIVVTGDNNPTTNSNLTTTTSNSSNSNLTTTSNSSSSSSSSSSVTTTVVQGVRSKSAPYFGHTLAWRNPADRALWCRMFLHARHLHDLTPPPQHVNLMTN